MTADPGVPETVITNELEPAAPKPTIMPAAKTKMDRNVPDPDRLLMAAKQVVVDNYNLSRDVDRSQELTMNSVYIIWFTKTLGSWRAIVGSPIARGLIWDVTFNSYKRETLIDVYKKINKVTVTSPA